MLLKSPKPFMWARVLWVLLLVMGAVGCTTPRPTATIPPLLVLPTATVTTVKPSPQVFVVGATVSAAGVPNLLPNLPDLIPTGTVSQPVVNTVPVATQAMSVTIVDTATPTSLAFLSSDGVAAAVPRVTAMLLLPTREGLSVIPMAPNTPDEIVPPTTLFSAPSPTPIEVASAPTMIALEAVLGDTNAMMNALMTVDLFTNFGTPQTVEIAARGRQTGIRARVFSVIGDSNSVSGDFLRPLVIENYCEWGGFSPLQETIAYFSSPPDAISATSFTHESISAQMGFNSAAALDSFWATDALCYPGETPVACELRSNSPAVIVIMLGGKDVSRMSLNQYQQNMTRIVSQAVGQGTIPILTTFVVEPASDYFSQSLAFNLALVDLARQWGIPLVNLWAAASRLPGYGIAADGTHLRTQPGRFCDFAGGERLYGGTLRNLMTLQALDQVRTGVLQPR